MHVHEMIIMRCMSIIKHRCFFRAHFLMLKIHCITANAPRQVTAAPAEPQPTVIVKGPQLVAHGTCMLNIVKCERRAIIFLSNAVMWIVSNTSMTLMVEWCDANPVFFYTKYKLLYEYVCIHLISVHVYAHAWLQTPTKVESAKQKRKVTRLAASERLSSIVLTMLMCLQSNAFNAHLILHD